MREPSDLAVEIPPVRDEFRQPDIDEFAPYHVGCTHLYEQLDISEYFAVRAKENLQSFCEWQGYAPHAEPLARASNIMEPRTYRTRSGRVLTDADIERIAEEVETTDLELTRAKVLYPPGAPQPALSAATRSPRSP